MIWIKGAEVGEIHLYDKHQRSDSWFGELMSNGTGAEELKLAQEAGKRSIIEGRPGKQRIVRDVGVWNWGWAA